MNYEDMKAAELRALCEAKGIKPSRSKADMIADLEARDSADELTRLSQELNLPDEPMPGSEEVWPPEVPEELRKPGDERTARPVATLVVPHIIEDGTFYKEFPRGETLEQPEHEANLRRITHQAEASGFETFGPAFRAPNRTTRTDWVYGINIR